jgi:hypothetical protein
MPEANSSIAPKTITSNIESLIGKKFGIVEVKFFAGTAHSKSIWGCECDCGKIFICRGNNLKSGGTKSCGCVRLNTLIKRNTKHGKSKKEKGSRSSVYGSWVAMKTRVTNPNATGSINYFYRGITMDSKWHSFDEFYKDMGEPPSPKHSLDRIDVNQGYSAQNCRWADRVTQNNNRRDNVKVEWSGKTWNITDLAKAIGMNRRLLFQRIYLGWTVERAVSQPKQYFTKKQK